MNNAEDGLIAYDCTADSVNVTTFSLIDVEPCENEWDDITTENSHIQVVQTKRIFDIKIYQCKVIFKREVSYCGMHSHTAPYQNSFKHIVREFTPEECRRVHETQSLKVHGEIYIHELTRNGTSHGKLVIAGHIEHSTCYGSNYFDGTTHFTKALVTMEYEILLAYSMAKFDTSDGHIQLKGGLICPFELGSCLDSREGYITWDTHIDSDCTASKYTVIYEGPANKTFIKKSTGRNTNILFSATSEDQLFSIKVKESYTICGFPGYASDHAQMYILETSPGTRFIKNTEINPKELDIITYFNSKITVVENHLGTQLSLLYQKLMNELCKVEKSLLETRLISARINPHEFASNLMKGPGYTAVIAGEVIHIIQCRPTYVTLSIIPECYQEIPVNKNNEHMFMSPVTHILQRKGTQIECTPILPSKFRLGGDWYSIDGTARSVASPNRLSTEVQPNWKYYNLPNLMKKGIYGQANVKKMHDMIYESEDRRSASVVIHRIIAGEKTDHQGFDLSHMFNENVIERTINKYWDKFWSFTTIVGQLTSSLVGFWLMGKCIKFIIDSIVHGRILFDIYGMSWKLIASFWDSLTNLLTHKHHYQKTRLMNPNQTNNVDQTEINDIRQTAPTEQIITPCTYPLLNQPEVTIQISSTERDRR